MLYSTFIITKIGAFSHTIETQPLFQTKKNWSVLIALNIDSFHINNINKHITYA